MLELPNHEDLSRLAKDDPQAYEALRSELIESFLDRAPQRLQSRLRGIQFRINGIRRVSRSPLGSTLKIYEYMWKSFQHLNRGWQEVVCIKDRTLDIEESTLFSEPVPAKDARVIEFRPSMAREPK